MNIPKCLLALTGVACAGLCFTAASAEIAFTNIASDPEMNLNYERARSAGYADLLGVYAQSLATPVSMEQVFASTIHRPGGFAGVALLDHDNDGDLDIYVTNGPGAANGLFSNQLRETGRLSFTDLSATSGADARDLDSNGVCFGDLDNDGDDDLYLLGREAGNRLYENRGGRFEEVVQHGAEAGNLSHISCAMGDIDGDGLLDIAVSNAFDLSSALALVAVPYDLSHRNQLFKNQGALSFTDISDSSGIRNMKLRGTDDRQPATISWAVSIVDLDRDGDVDIVFGDDQAALPNAARGGFDRGYLQVFLNDGSGHFSNAPVHENAYSSAAWMGLGFGDFNCDGNLDIFASNLGDYMFAAMGMPAELGAEATRWLLGRGDATFSDAGTGTPTVFGWGNAVADLDNDGDQDLLYHGAMDLNAVITHDNPGVVLENRNCGAVFREHLQAFRGDYSERGTQGVAVGDLDQDGYIDVVTASNHNVPDSVPFVVSPAQYGADLDATARFYLPMLPDANTGLLTWGGVQSHPGSLTVEINDGQGAGAVSFRTLGSVGLTGGGRNNRSGIGALVSFTPHNGDTVTAPVMGGASFVSQNALEAHFGLGGASRGTVDVYWLGGTHNRLYGVRAGEHIVLPEIPCSIDSAEPFARYAGCVREALNDLRRGRHVTARQALRLQISALIGYFDRDR